MAEKGKQLVIVESPAKARTIAGYLGDSYAVESSIGHIRDLPQGALTVTGNRDRRLAGRVVAAEGVHARPFADEGRAFSIVSRKWLKFSSRSASAVDSAAPACS